MKYNMFKFWLVLKDECDKVSLGENLFENARQIKKIQILFEKMSEIFLAEFDVKDLAKMYTDFNPRDVGETYIEFFEEFKNYVYYASDRMNINRWLHSKMLINMAFDLVYASIDVKEWYNNCSRWIDNGDISLLENEVYTWFNENFDNLYKAKDKED